MKPYLKQDIRVDHMFIIINFHNYFFKLRIKHNANLSFVVILPTLLYFH